MTIFNIEVSLNEKQANTAIRHFEDVRVKNMVADIQGTVQSFFDQLVEEDATKKAENEKKQAKESKIIFMTPVGIVEIEDDEDDD